MASRTPPKPEPIRGEDGRLQYPGSLSLGADLSGAQKDDIDEKLRSGEPQTPSTLVGSVDGLAQNNVHHHEIVRRHLATLERNGKIEQVKDTDGNLLGWRAVPE